MRTKVEFQSVEPSSLHMWRGRYIAGLEKPQALLLEMMMPGCEALSINRKAERIGYALLGPARTLIEFYLEPGAWIYSDDIAGQLVEQAGISRAIVKSFDAMMMSSLLHVQKRVQVMGFLARDYAPLALPASLAPNMQSRVATAEDLDALCAVEQDVFLDPSRFAQAIEAGEVIVYWNGSDLLGFGMLRVVRPEQEALEINIAVDLAHRRRAFAAYMLEDLVKRCVARGMAPIASCPKDNQASRILGERVGLSSRDRLLEFSF